MWIFSSSFKKIKQQNKIPSLLVEFIILLTGFFFLHLANVVPNALSKLGNKNSVF